MWKVGTKIALDKLTPYSDTQSVTVKEIKLQTVNGDM